MRSCCDRLLLLLDLDVRLVNTSARMQLSRMEAYLKRLPDGLDSYPTVLQQAAVFETFIQGAGIHHYRDQLPEELARWVVDPPPAGSWVPEVKATATYLACADLCFASDDAYVQFAYRANRKLITGPLYLILFHLLGPRRICTGAAARWEQMHRGSTLSQVEVTNSTFHLSLQTPEHHVPPLIARCYGTAIQAALEVAGGDSVFVSTAMPTPSVVELTGSWVP